MARIVAFGGVSNSGKTTLIEKLILLLSDKYDILAIKHDSKNKAVFDTYGKDSEKFFRAGADVVISSNEKSAIFLHNKQELQKICLDFAFKDYIFIEGYKDIAIPRICVAREKIFYEEIKNSHAIAIDDMDLSWQKNGFCGEILNLNEVMMIFKWIEKNAKTPKELGWI